MIPALELLAVIAAAAASLRWPTFALIGLVGAGSLARWGRGKSWIEPQPLVPWLAAAGAAVGAIALTIAVVASPLLEDLTDRSIDWTQLAAVRGNPGALVSLGMLVTAQAVGAELVYRRWIVDRLIDAGARPILAVLGAALAEGMVAGGHLGARAGAMVLGAGLGLLYLGAGRRLAPAIACRIVFDVGALTLVGMRLV